ncbi:hypothetical protein J7M07_06240 [bacterium]|nr:hypothetical protein [bacterium]
MFEAVGNILLEIGLWGFAAATVLILFSLFIYRKCFPSISGPKRFVLAGLRSLAFLSLVLFFVNPLLTYLATEKKTPIIPILVDVSKSMSIKDCSGESRIAFARSVIDGLLINIGDKHSADIEIIPFSKNLWKNPVQADSIPEAEGEGTDITGSIEAVANRYRYSKPAGIILLTDGIQTNNRTLIEGINLPVYSIGFGNTLKGGYLSIEDIIYERRVYSGMKTKIETIVAAKGLRKNVHIKARLFEDDELIDSVLVVAENGEGEYRAVFDYLAGKASDHRMKIILECEEMKLSGRRSEGFNLGILEEVRHILYIDEHADWNMKFLRDLAGEMKRFDFDFVTWNPGQGYIKIPKYLKWQFPSGSDGLKRYDLVIISDAERTFSIAENADILIDYVHGGGGVVFLADESSPLIYDSSFKLLEDIIPVKKLSLVRASVGEYYLRLSPEGNNTVSVMLSECGGIYELPPLPVYLEGFNPSMGTTVPLYLDENKGDLKPLVAIERSGEGVSGVVLGMPLWRWRLAGIEGEKIYNTFFSSLIQYFASGADRQPLEVVSSRNRYNAGEEPQISVHLGKRRLPKAIKGRLYKMEKEGNELIRTFIFDPKIPERGVFRVKLPSLGPGRYRVAAREILDSGKGFEGETEFSVDSLSVEYIHRSMDGDFLKRLSKKSGGQFFVPNEAEGIINRLNPHVNEVHMTRTTSFRSNIVFFFVIILFLTTEWILRKIWGLV